MSTKKVLCVHGVGGHPKGGEWQALWTKALEKSLNRLGKDADLDVSFFHYDTIFGDVDLSLLGTLEALAKLSASGVIHGFNDLFRSSEQPVPGKRGARAARGVKDRLRWTAGMVVQWAENEQLRTELRDALAKAVRNLEPDVVFAHSLGSLVAYDTFHSPDHAGLSQNRVFVSLGSQIGSPFVRSQFAGRIQPLDDGYWYHLFNIHDDVFTAPIHITEDGFEQVSTSFDIAGFADHDAPEYLAHQNVTQSVWADVLASARPRRKARQVRRDVRRGGSHDRRALIIGIDDYDDPEMRLEGCVNDAFLMSEVLQENGYDGGDIRLILNHRATAEEIWRRLEWLLDGTTSGQHRVLCFSGHGAQLPDYGSDETVDRVDECLVPYDFDWTPERAITDDRFHELYSQLPYDAKFIAILDCCHSGGMTRAGGGRPRGLSPPDDIRHRTMRWDVKNRAWVRRKPPDSNLSLAGNTATRKIGYMGKYGQRRLLRSTDVLTLNNREFNAKRKQLDHYGPYLPVIIQACQEDELAYEYRHGVTSYGAFSYSLAQMLRDPEHQGADLSRLEQLTQRYVTNIVDNQVPIFVAPGPRYDLPLFETETK